MLEGVTDLPAELSRCFLLIQELDEKSKTLQTQIEDRCRKHVLGHTAEYEVCVVAIWYLSLQILSTCTSRLFSWLRGVIMPYEANLEGLAFPLLLYQGAFKQACLKGPLGPDNSSVAEQHISHLSAPWAAYAGIVLLQTLPRHQTCILHFLAHIQL